MSSEFKYYTLSKSKEDKGFYFAHNGLFNFWNEYIIFHKDDLHLLLVNNTTRKFSEDPNITSNQLQDAVNILKNEYESELYKHSGVTRIAAQTITNIDNIVKEIKE